MQGTLGIYKLESGRCIVKRIIDGKTSLLNHADEWVSLDDLDTDCLFSQEEALLAHNRVMACLKFDGIPCEVVWSAL